MRQAGKPISEENNKIPENKLTADYFTYICGSTY